jgi:3-oxoacyl-[acyl-carrier-protein] synthase III
MPSFCITGVGSYVPPTILTNDDLAKMVETNDEWITQRTGIKERRIAEAGVASSDLMVPAAQKALAMAHKTVADIDLILVSYSFPDQVVPLTSDTFAYKLGAPKATPALDVIAECVGFCQALGEAYDKMRLYPRFRTVLVVSGDAITKFVDYQDRATCILFGDGAGAVVVEKVDEEGFGILGYRMHSDREFINCLSTKAGGTVLPASAETVAQREHYIHFGADGGGPMLKAIVRKVPELRSQICADTGVPLEAISLVIPHQMNKRITDASKKQSPTPIYDRNIARYGNSAGSSIPLALDMAFCEGEIKRGDYVLLEAYGAGMKYGNVILRWWLPANNKK